MTNHTALSAQSQPPLKGDETDLFGTLNPRLVRVVRRSTAASDALVEDACSYAWIQMLRRQPDREYLFGWLHTTAMREAWNLSARERRTLSLDNTVETDGDAMTLADLIPGVDLDLQIAAREALQAVATLRPLHRTAFARHLAGLTYTEIADETGRTFRQVERHVKRSRRAIRETRSVADQAR